MRLARMVAGTEELPIRRRGYDLDELVLDLFGVVDLAPWT